jgi:hypothetical protein
MLPLCHTESLTHIYVLSTPSSYFYREQFDVSNLMLVFKYLM